MPLLTGQVIHRVLRKMAFAYLKMKIRVPVPPCRTDFGYDRSPPYRVPCFHQDLRIPCVHRREIISVIDDNGLAEAQKVIVNEHHRAAARGDDV